MLQRLGSVIVLRGRIMMDVYTLQQSEQWDAVVRSFEKHDVYWFSGYVKAFQLHGDGEPLLFYYEGTRIRGINVVMRRDIAQDKSFIGKISRGQYFDFSTPYGYGGWIIEGENVGELFEAYSEWIEEHEIICEFVRFHPMIGNHAICRDFYEVVKLGEVVHMDLSSPEIIWNNIISKNRNVIRKARKHNVKVYNGRYPEIFQQFREIYNKTMEKDDAEDYYYFDEVFFKSVLNDLPQNAQIFYAQKDDKIIAASIMLAANGRMNYHLSGSLEEYNSLAANNLMLYEAALWGFYNGCKTFYLGGGVGSGKDSLFKFKRAFYRGELNHFYIGKKIFDWEKYDELLNRRGRIDNLSYFPMYRG